MTPRRRFELLFMLGMGLLIAATFIGAGVTVWSNERWPAASGYVQACSPIYSYHMSTGTIPTRTVSAESCSVRWTFNSEPHAGGVTLSASTRVGDVVPLYVNGDAVVSEYSQSGGYALGGLGVGILVVVVWGAWKAHRERSHPHEGKRARRRDRAARPVFRRKAR